MLYWVGTMSSIKNQAEEIIIKELIYVKNFIDLMEKF